MVSSYRKRIQEFANMSRLATWCARIQEEDLLTAIPPKLRDRWQTSLDKADRSSHVQVLEKMTDMADNQQRIVESAPFVVCETETQRRMPIRKAMGVFFINTLRPYPLTGGN
jgi:hypothetical protein